MTYGSKDKFDYLLDMALCDCGGSDVDFFSSLDDSGVTLSDRLNRIIRRLISREEHKTVRRKVRTVFTRLAVAILIIMSLMLALIACVPVLRDAVWEVIVEWTEDYIHVDMQGTQSPDNTDNTEIPDDFTENNVVPPPYIQQFREPVVDTETVEAEVIGKNDAGYMIDYYIGDDWYFTYLQSVLGDGFKTDSEVEDIKIVKVHEYDALLTIDENNTENVLIWSDGEYLFWIYSTIDESEMIKLAESVK